ncbi:hypothetical protein Rs2_43098 [Raphanus sativus]|nr:hypothetical protein Rs2_43098 [Raphanus sativus]
MLPPHASHHRDPDRTAVPHRRPATPPLPHRKRLDSSVFSIGKTPSLQRGLLLHYPLLTPRTPRKGDRVRNNFKSPSEIFITLPTTKPTLTLKTLALCASHPDGTKPFTATTQNKLAK